VESRICGRRFGNERELEVGLASYDLPAREYETRC